MKLVVIKACRLHRARGCSRVKARGVPSDSWWLAAVRAETARPVTIVSRVKIAFPAVAVR